MVLLLGFRDSGIEFADADGYTTLLEAAIKGHGAAVELLIEKSANVQAKINGGSIALHCAAVNQHSSISAILTEKGANVNALNA